MKKLTIVLELIALLAFLGFGAIAVGAQTPLPTATYLDSFKFDVLKVDLARPGFKVQIQMTVQTGTWSDIPAATLGTPLQLSDTSPDSLTYQLPVSKTTPAGEHTMFIRFCATEAGSTTTFTCSTAASIRFLLQAQEVIGAPRNLRFGPKSGGVSTMGRTSEMPRVVGNGQ